MLFFVSQYFFLQSQLFEQQSISIRGTESLSETLVEGQLGQLQGVNFWELSESSLEANLKSLHLIEDASVSLVFPREVRVYVSERKPSFFVANKREVNKWHSADKDGVVLKGVAPTEGQLKIFLPHRIKEGSQLRSEDLQVIRYFQDRLGEELKSSIRAIDIEEGQQVSVKTVIGKDPVWVKLGRPERLEYKLFLLGELLQQLSKERSVITSIDLRFSAPVVKKKGANPVVASDASTQASDSSPEADVAASDTSLEPEDGASDSASEADASGESEQAL